MKKLMFLFFGFLFFSETCFSKEVVTDKIGLDCGENLLLAFPQNEASPTVYDTIRSLVISEVRLDNMQYAYVEITNMSETDAIDLSNVSLGNLTPWMLPWSTDRDHSIRLPKKILWPGESFVIADIYDLPGKMKHIDPERWVGRQCTQLDMWELADMQIHVAETDYGYFPKYDSVSPTGRMVLETWNGRDVYFLRQHLSPTDSVVIDEVNADFSRLAGYPQTVARTVSGVVAATSNSILIRKFSVKTGDLFGDDWFKIKGANPEDSEWIPIPLPKNGWGKEGIQVKSFWTVGNHGNFKLTPENFKSSTVDINWVDSVLTVPWGTRKDYRILDYFDYTPGLAWNYTFSPNREDSAFTSVRTGDILTLYACGNKLERWDFKIVVSEPTNGANIVIPKNSLNSSGKYGPNPYNVTINAPGLDTIYDIGFATRIDTLLKYLEKAPAATWEMVSVDGIVRPDLKNGDKFEVTAKNGAVKNYFIKVDAFLPSHEAYLSSITWPDIPATLRGQNGWKGDMIPGFKSTEYNYSIKLPADVLGIPALVAKTSDTDASFEMTRVKNFEGSIADRTVTIKTTAEDDTTFLTYRIILSKEKAPTDIQPFKVEPFFSQRTHRVNFYGSAMEICNPGNVPVDLSNYMLVRGGNDGSPAATITKAKTADFNTRYNFYIPGRVWGNKANWQTNSYRAFPDFVVNPVIQGNDVFVVAAVGGNYYGFCDDPDVEFWPNPWGDTLITAGDEGLGGNPVRGMYKDTTDTYYLFKILNDSVKNGAESVGDPSDFKLIDVFGNGNGTMCVIGGFPIDQPVKIESRPQFWQGNSEYKGSFGTTTAITPKRYPPSNDGQWDVYDRAWFGTHGYPYPSDVRIALSGLGSHTFNPITLYKSTVTSKIYKVSTGYSMNETIKGVITGTTVDQFLTNIIKDDPGQTLILKRRSTELFGGTTLNYDDTLVVKSQVYKERDGDPEKQNTTKYILKVTTEGLGFNAILTSASYTITINGNTGTISGFPYGTKLKSVVGNVVVPEGATFAVVDAENKWVSFKMLNFDTAYVDVLVNDKTYFEVIAEDKVTTIRYQLKPTSTSSDPFVESNVYSVDQAAILIKFIPRNTSVQAFLANLIPSPGATAIVIDKNKNARRTGNIYQDDKVFVSKTGYGWKVYYLSMLSTRENGIIPVYTAYVQSNVYSIDQLFLTIRHVNACYPTCDEFLANLNSPMGTSVAIVDNRGNEVLFGKLYEGYKVKVTSADGNTVTYYSIEFGCNDVKIIENIIQVYPNPTTGIISIKGIGTGCRIRIYNAMGINIGNEVTQTNLAEISLGSQPPGIYLILVENDNQLIGRFKVVRK